MSYYSSSNKKFQSTPPSLSQSNHSQNSKSFSSLDQHGTYTDNNLNTAFIADYPPSCSSDNQSRGFSEISSIRGNGQNSMNYVSIAPLSEWESESQSHFKIYLEKTKSSFSDCYEGMRCELDMKKKKRNNQIRESETISESTLERKQRQLFENHSPNELSILIQQVIQEQYKTSKRKSSNML